MEAVWSAVGGLIVGLAIGFVGHLLAGRRSKGERAIADATALWERCSEIASARVRYIVAFHRRAPDVAQIKEQHLDIKRRYRWADPEVILAGTSEWEAYHDAERSALLDKDIPIKVRIKRVEATSYVLQDAIGKRRIDARK